MSRPIEVLLHHMRGVAESRSKWEADFARSILSQSKRRNWHPSEKQHALIDRLVGELFNETDCEVLEEFSPAEAGPCSPVGLKDGGGGQVQPTTGRDYRQRAVRKVEAQSPVYRAARRK